MTELPPERHDEPLVSDWEALLTGDVPVQTAVTTVDHPPHATASQPGPNDPFAPPPEQPRSRREAREAAARAAAHEHVDPSRPSRAERRAAAASGYDQPARPKRRGRAAFGCLGALLVLALLAGGAYVFLQAPITALVHRLQPADDYQGGGTGQVVFVIHEGDNGSDIANNLVKQGVIASYDAFYPLLLNTKPEPQFKPGAIRMKHRMSAQAALTALLDPKNQMQDTFVIPEGTAVKDALPLIAETTKIPIAQLQAAAAEPPASYGLPAEAKNLEGFLFPATYTLDPGINAHQALKTLVDRQFTALDQAGVPVAQRWHTIVLASLIQREAGLKDDYYKVSRVFQNRLNPKLWSSGLLQSDATVAYGTGHTDRVSTTDAERADASNPYNTYQHPGLPVGPISNPGDLAIDAALHPAAGDWLYFVTWNLQTGETIFSSTAAEHDAAVKKWQDWMDQHPEYK